MYCKCRNIAFAEQVFEGMVCKDAPVWNSLILGYVENGNSSLAMDLFAKMDGQPDCFTYIAALKACGRLASEKESEKQICLQKGIEIHKQVKEQGLESDLFVANILVDMYSKCGSMQQARDVFDRMVSKTVVTWSCLLLGYVQNGESLLALDLFSSMDCEPNSVTYVAALKACGGLADEQESNKRLCLEKGIAIHKQAEGCGLGSDLFVANALVNMYSKCGSMHRAREVFDNIDHKDRVAWNSIILGYAENGQSLAAIDLFTRMDCEADSFTFVAVLKACGALACEEESERHFCLQKGIDIHEQIRVRGLESNIFVANTLVDMYSKCGNMQAAREVFDRMASKNVVAWNALLLGYSENGQSLTALDLFTNMDFEADSLTYVAALKACGILASEREFEKHLYLDRGIAIHKQAEERGFDSNIFVGNTLVDMYSKCGNMDYAREVFDRMASKTVVSWTSSILGYLLNGKSSEALELFSSMDCEPSYVTYIGALKACGNLVSLPTGQQIHARLCSLGLEQDPLVSTSLVDFYAKCGNMSKAREVFNNRESPSTAAWNALMAGYSSLGDLSEVFNLAKTMRKCGIGMNDITFTCILAACSHTGLVQEGKLCFDFMLASGITSRLEHYTCMIDLLGRANKLQEALDLVKSMPFEANVVTWRSLLGACSKWGNSEVGKAAFDAMVASGTAEASAYILLGESIRV